jgi:hypothetical protein
MSRLPKPGTRISNTAEIQGISSHGIWLYVRGKEYLLPYTSYPWFQQARVADVCRIKLLHDTHLYWPALDIDLELESLEDPEHYPLVYR